jgi:hypothetical protein
MSIIYGPQGSGKSVVVEVFATLFGRLAMLNIDDLDKVFGKFNALLCRYLAMIINEPPDAKSKFGYNGRIKARATHSDLALEMKGVE